MNRLVEDLERELDKEAADSSSSPKTEAIESRKELGEDCPLFLRYRIDFH